jgi:hypothetical protein
MTSETYAQTGRGTTKEAGQRAPEGTGRVFPCDQCGADLTFHIGTQRLKCPRCDFEKVIEVAGEPPVVEQDLKKQLSRLADKRRNEQAAPVGTQEVSCESCGATIVFNGTLTSKECDYCGAPRQRGGVHQATSRVPVDGVLPFLVEQKAAGGNLGKWVKSRWFAPNEFVRRGVDGALSGIYLPYWTFDAMTQSWYSGQRGEHYWVTTGSGQNQKREMRTRWHPASGSFQRFFDDVMVCATQGLPRQQVLDLEPWPMDRVIPYTQQVLAGYLAHTYEVELPEGFDDAKRRMEEALRDETRRRIGGDTQRIDHIRTKYDALTFKHLLLPVWMMTYRYHGKPYRVMVNACTGEVQGERPYSAIKIGIAVVAGILVLALLIYFFGGERQ